MKTQKRMFMAIACASCAATLFGTATDVPVVSNVNFDQPVGGRTVTVTYDLADAPAIVTVDTRKNGEARTERGGSFVHNAPSCTSSYRTSDQDNTRYRRVGFRVVSRIDP